MTKRRQFGTVRRLPSDRWQARYRNVTGDLVTARRTFPTKGDASRWLSGVESDQARGVWVDPRAARVRLKVYAEEWLASHARISPRTREIYESQLRLHICPRLTDDLPALGEVALGDITPELVRRWYGTLLRARGSSVAAKAYTRLRQILGQAVDDDRIVKNPCRIEAAVPSITRSSALHRWLSSMTWLPSCQIHTGRSS